MKKLLFILGVIFCFIKPLNSLLGKNEYLDIAIIISIFVIVLMMINEMMKPRVVEEDVQPFMQEDEQLLWDDSSFLVELNQNIELSPDEMVYVADEEDETLTILLENYPEVLEAWAQTIGFQIIYLPMLVKRLKEKRVFQYHAPYLNDEEVAKIDIHNDFLLQYFSNPADKNRVKQGFIRVDNVHRTNSDSDKPIIRFYPLSAKSNESLPDQLDKISKQIVNERSQQDFHIENTDAKSERALIGSDNESKENSEIQKSNDDTNDLIEEVRERIAQLRQRGISQFILEQLIHPDNRLSRLVVTKDYRIVLPDYNDMEIKMEPLVKSVYLLFLRHPEGIMFKFLPDYREELARIYAELRPVGLTDKALQSIEDVTNPLLNSINEKCARIRGAFVGQFDDYMAKNYYIDGLRGEAKKISLPRNLVVWE